MSIYLCQQQTIVFQGHIVSRLITPMKLNAPVTPISRFIVIWNHRRWLSVELILYFHVTPLMCMCSLDDILSLPLMYKSNSTQRSIILLSLPLHPLCFILAITLGKNITSDQLRSLSIFSPCSPSYSWPWRWASAWPNKTNKQSLGVTHLQIPIYLSFIFSIGQ